MDCAVLCEVIGCIMGKWWLYGPILALCIDLVKGSLLMSLLLCIVSM